MILSVGHSSLSEKKFLKLLQANSVEMVVDVRSHPSSHWIQFLQPSLRQSLSNVGIDYSWWPNLGGWSDRFTGYARTMKEHGVDVEAYSGPFPRGWAAAIRELPEGDPGWKSQGLHDFSFFMTLPEFRSSAELLVAKGEKTNIAMMCAEALWWKCHRAQIADYVVFMGFDVKHISPPPTLHSAVAARRIGRYDPYVLKIWGEWKAATLTRI
jgi:uncharacterized protein (DUF488 family)